MDALLCFPSEEIAVQFGSTMGYTDITGESPSTCLASHGHAIHIIGEHFQIIDEVAVGDGKWWVLFRCPHDMPIPEGAESFVVWASFQVDENGDPVPRPSDPEFPSVSWS